MDIYRPPLRAPGLPASPWLNSYETISLEALRGRVVLLDFWEYTCINCLRTLPYLRDWDARYREYGLQILGIHTPEFSFSHEPSFLQSAIGRIGITWPVLIDGEQRIWTEYANRYWPTHYLIDGQGRIRSRHEGEGNYNQIEGALRALLIELDPTVEIPPPATAQEDDQHWVPGCEPGSHEMHIDSGLALSGEVDMLTDDLIHSEDVEGTFYLAGDWETEQDGLWSSSRESRLILPYTAKDCYAVLSTSEIASSQPSGAVGPITIELHQDEEPLPTEAYGFDVFQSQGKACVRVDEPRLYNLVQNPVHSHHVLEIIPQEPGLILYAFSFGNCSHPSLQHPITQKE